MEINSQLPASMRVTDAAEMRSICFPGTGLLGSFGAAYFNGVDYVHVHVHFVSSFPRNASFGLLVLCCFCWDKMSLPPSCDHLALGKVARFQNACTHGSPYAINKPIDIKQQRRRYETLLFFRKVFALSTAFKPSAFKPSVLVCRERGRGVCCKSHFTVCVFSIESWKRSVMKKEKRKMPGSRKKCSSKK